MYSICFKIQKFYDFFIKKIHFPIDTNDFNHIYLTDNKQIDVI